MPFLRFLSSLGAFLAAAVAGVMALKPVFPIERDSGLFQRKKDRFLEAKEQFNALFIGSSRVYRHIDPQIFGETAKAHGIDVRGFNFGIDGMFAPEDSYVAEDIMSYGPKLRWVFVEHSSFFPAHYAEVGLSERDINWHDATRTWAVLRSAIKPRKPARNWKNRRELWRKSAEDLMARWPELRLHVQAFALRTANIGRGAATLDRWMQKGPAKNKGRDLGVNQDGFMPIEKPAAPADIAYFQREMADRRRQPGKLRPLLPEAQRNLGRVLAAIRKVGAEPVLLAAPVPVVYRFMPAEGTNVPVLDFTDMERFPELYEVQYRQDHGHLNAAGAAVFSRVMAETWAASRGAAAR